MRWIVYLLQVSRSYTHIIKVCVVVVVGARSRTKRICTL